MVGAIDKEPLSISSSRTDKFVLVVEDEADLADVISFNLQKEGYQTRVVATAAGALTEIRNRIPDLLLLDRMLPDRPGDEIATELRRAPRTSQIPIIMMTAKAEEADELVGFAIGADDYITKPFSMKILLARVGAMLRRGQADAQVSDTLTAGPIRLDRARHEVLVGEAAAPLTSTEFKLLWELVAASGRVLAREQLIDAVLGPTVAVTDRTIDVHIAALRKKLGDASTWIQTVRGVGYTLREPN